MASNRVGTNAVGERTVVSDRLIKASLRPRRTLCLVGLGASVPSPVLIEAFNVNTLKPFTSAATSVVEDTDIARASLSVASAGNTVEF